MGLFDRFESKIQGAVNGAFAHAFKGDVQPVEITQRLQRELDAGAKLLSRDKALVPNEFTVYLSRHDYDSLVPMSKAVTAQIVPELRSHAAERYVFSGPISIAYELDTSLPTGKFNVSSQAVAKVDQPDAPSTTMIRRAPLVLEVNGVRHPLTPPGLLIGRGSEADLRINDPGVSRRHAQIVVTGSGDDVAIRIEDLGSTNGIIVNGQKVRASDLDDGSRIEIGSTRMLVHSPTGA